MAQNITDEERLERQRAGGRYIAKRMMEQKTGIHALDYDKTTGRRIAEKRHPHYSRKAGKIGGPIAGRMAAESGSLRFSSHVRWHILGSYIDNGKFRKFVPPQLKPETCEFCRSGQTKFYASGIPKEIKMFDVKTVTEEDRSTIQDWALRDIDEDHHNIPADFWMTGAPGFHLNFKVVDDQGPVMFVRLEPAMVGEEVYCRFHTQFAPEAVVSKRRLVPGMLTAFKVFIPHLQGEGFRGMVAMTKFHDLARFLEKQGFARVEGTSDYRLIFMAAPAASSTEKQCVTVQN